MRIRGATIPRVTPVALTITLNPSVDTSVQIEELVPQHKLRAHQLRTEPGGGGVNVARALHRFGVPAKAIVVCGGIAGHELIHVLKAEGVPVQSIEADVETRRSTTLWVSSTRQHYRIVVDGPSLPETAWRGCIDAASRVDPAPDFVVLSGSFPPGAPADAIVGQLAAVSRARGCFLIVDSSGPGLSAAVDHAVDLVKPSRGELRTLIGADEAGFDHRAAAHALVERGVGAVVVSLGRDGAYVAGRDGTSDGFDAADVEELSSVGAGDSMVAGIVAGLHAGRPLLGAVRLGMAAGAATCMMPGTALGRLEDVMRIDERLAAPAPKR